MISKDTFVKTMTKLEALDKRMDNVDAAMKALCSDFCGFYIPDILDITLDILEEVFKDEGHWISYCALDLKWLQDAATGYISAYGKEVDLSSWGKVYDFLIKNMEYKYWN